MSNPLLTMDGVSKVYDTVRGSLTVLEEVSFQVKHGEILALTGASGVGKSTLLHLMGGLDRASSGEIRFKNKLLSSMTKQDLAIFRNSSVGFVFQFHHLLPEFNALENVAMPLLMRKNSSIKSSKAAAIDILKVVGLQDRLEHLPAQLSGGEQQRVALARAMVTSPDIVLADEPTGNLDTHTGRLVFEMIRDLNQKFNVSFVIATHNLELAQSSHRWLKMSAGSVAEMNEGEGSEILAEQLTEDNLGR